MYFVYKTNGKLKRYNVKPLIFYLEHVFNTYTFNLVLVHEKMLSLKVEVVELDTGPLPLYTKFRQVVYLRHFHCFVILSITDTLNLSAFISVIIPGYVVPSKFTTTN